MNQAERSTEKRVEAPDTGMGTVGPIQPMNRAQRRALKYGHRLRTGTRTNYQKIAREDRWAK